MGPVALDPRFQHLAHDLVAEMGLPKKIARRSADELAKRLSETVDDFLHDLPNRERDQDEAAHDWMWQQRLDEWLGK